MSGRPLFEPSTRLLARAYLLTGGAMPLIGCGGVEDSETALAKIEAGANLVQLYTGLALKGHGVVEEILDGLSRAVEARGLNRIGELVGARASAWAGLERADAGDGAPTPAKPAALVALRSDGTVRPPAQTTDRSLMKPDLGFSWLLAVSLRNPRFLSLDLFGFPWILDDYNLDKATAACMSFAYWSPQCRPPFFKTRSSPTTIKPANGLRRGCGPMAVAARIAASWITPRS